MMSVVLLLSLCMYLAESIRPYRLRVEYQEDPRGIDVTNPRFFWAIDGEMVRGAMQSAYQIVVYTTGDQVVVDTGKVTSSQSSHVTIDKLTLMSYAHYKWTVQIYDSSGKSSDMETAYFSAGLLNQPSDWKSAEWIGIAKGTSNQMNQFRTEFSIKPNTAYIERAQCYVAVPGYYVAYLNENQLDDHALGYFTTFEERAYYDTVECTDYLKNNDANTFGIVLGNGWYSQPSVNVGVPMAKILIYIEFSDNTTQSIVSNGKDWYQAKGAIRMNDIYQGEWYDATQETPGWLRKNYNYSSWTAASVISSPIIGVLSSSAIMPKSRKVESYTPVAITEPSKGVFVVDFGQNLAGYCQIRIPGNGARGQNVTLIHSEELNEAGFVVQMYGNSPMIATYTLRGDGNDEVYEPVFTYFGYQYVQISGLPSTLGQNEITSYFIHTDFGTEGSIEFGPSNINMDGNASNAYLLNAVQHMTRYASMSNFINIPTDCPQRERRGWLGDAQLSAETTIYNFDMAASYTKFIRDIRDSQIFYKTGELPDVVPFYHHGSLPGDPSWTNAYINLVYWMYHYYGDTRLIEQHYEGMTAQLNFQTGQLDKTTGLLGINAAGSHYGDWCAVTPNTGCPHKSAIINTYDYAEEALYLSRLATVVGNSSDATKWMNAFESAKQAIYKNFWDKSKNAFVDTQSGNGIPFDTAQALPLNIDVLNDTTERDACVQSLVSDIEGPQKGHLTAGIIGTKFILRELCRHQQCETALKTVLFRDYPSYGYWYENKATTLWENWQSSQYHADGSKNHIMFGAESNWYYQYLGGIRPTHNMSNWDMFEIDPYTNASLYDIQFIDTTVDTLKGKINVLWQVYPNGFVCGTGDEGVNIEISCMDEIASVPFASYGTPTGNCGTYKVDSSCNNNNSLSIVQGLCVGKKSCSIPVSNTEFKYDPCVDVKKHLDVEAVCKTPLTQTMDVTIPTGSTATIRFRPIPLNNQYIPPQQWVINEGSNTVFKAGAFVNGDDGVKSGQIVDDYIELTVVSGSYSFSRYG